MMRRMMENGLFRRYLIAQDIFIPTDDLPFTAVLFNGLRADSPDFTSGQVQFERKPVSQDTWIRKRRG